MAEKHGEVEADALIAHRLQIRRIEWSDGKKMIEKSFCDNRLNHLVPVFF